MNVSKLFLSTFIALSMILLSAQASFSQGKDIQQYVSFKQKVSDKGIIHEDSNYLTRIERILVDRNKKVVTSIKIPVAIVMKKVLIVLRMFKS